MQPFHWTVNEGQGADARSVDDAGGGALAVRIDAELGDELAKLCGHLREVLRGFIGFGGAGGSALRGLRNTHDVASDFAGAFGGFGDVA